MHHDEPGPLMRRRLEATVEELTHEFRGVFSRGTVERFVNESRDRLGGVINIGYRVDPPSHELPARRLPDDHDPSTSVD